MSEDVVKVRPTVVLELHDRGELFDCYFHHGTFDGLFIPGASAILPGTEVSLEVRFLEEGRTFHIRGIVKWNRAGVVQGLPAGLGVTFFASDHRPRDLLLEYAKGRTVRMVERRERRVGAAVEVWYERDSVFLRDATDNLSEHGAFISASVPLPIGEHVDLSLVVPGRTSPLYVAGEVVWAHHDEPPGFGVKFLFENEATRREVAVVVAELRDRIASRFGL